MTQPQEGRKYKFVNFKAGNVADLSGGDNTSVIGYDDNGGENQQWVAEQGSGGWAFKNAQTGRYLGVSGPIENGTAVVAVDNKFLWDIKSDKEGTIRLYVNDTKLNLDLGDHGNATAGTPVTIWTRWNGDNQLWYLKEA
ncbi:hypothetical protein ONZ45_g14731 [Pleurotus djamor]|nr:hypothetical protein ONZ45_g14731 [Pleurotus djamor]